VIYEVITAMKMSMLVFSVVTPCGFEGTNVSEKLTVTIFMARFNRLSIGTVLCFCGRIGEPLGSVIKFNLLTCFIT
jgi:hypothetical protein